MLENAEIRCQEEEDILTEAVYKVLPTLEEQGIRIGFETELPIEKYLKLASKFNSEYVGAYYDAGNCAACGHDMLQDMKVLGRHVISVHVKDRLNAGKSVFLGTGDTNFKEGIPYLIKMVILAILCCRLILKMTILEQQQKAFNISEGS